MVIFVISAVLLKVLERLDGKGSVIITDGPQTDSQFDKIMDRMNPEEWFKMGQVHGVSVEVLDLREDEWINQNDVTIERKKLPGDPRGSVLCDLGYCSEFAGHSPSAIGYYGADYNKKETNEAHSRGKHLYKVSRTVIEADVFINIPKLKTHKKAGITCSLKNLVGINTYKNFLPHHNEGTIHQGGDQFPGTGIKSSLEASLIGNIKQVIYEHPALTSLYKIFKYFGKRIFGETRHIVRSGNWYGNDTLWRMVLDLNKIIFYSDSNGMLKDTYNEKKKYISIVDGIIGGQGNGPESPDPINSNILIMGNNPVAVDAVAARTMGFDPLKIPSIKKAFKIKSYKINNFSYDDIRLNIGNDIYKLNNLPEKYILNFRPHFGWINNIEMVNNNEN